MSWRGYEWLEGRHLPTPKQRANRNREEARRVAKAIGITPSELAIAWCLQNPNVSTVITGATRPEQVKEYEAIFC